MTRTPRFPDGPDRTGADLHPALVAELRAAVLIDCDTLDPGTDASHVDPETRLLAWAMLKTRRGQTLHQTRLRLMRRAMTAMTTTPAGTTPPPPPSPPSLPPSTAGQRKAA